MKLIKASLLLLLAFCGSVAADVLNEISARLDTAEITEGNFRQEKRLKVLKKPLISTGTFTYHRSKGVIWKTLTPVPSLLLVNEARLLTHEGEQVMPMAFGRVFSAMLGGDLSRLTEGFDIAGVNQKTSWQLQLKPKDEMLKKIITGIELTGDKRLRLLEISEANGNFTRIEFDQITHPATLNPEQEAEFERLSSPN